jgi:CheY-like chemotaxis protein
MITAVSTTHVMTPRPEVTKLMTLLIVDDLRSNRKPLRAHLESEGHRVLEAGDGLEALQLLEREPVTAVISDRFMPNIDGSSQAKCTLANQSHQTRR